MRLVTLFLIAAFAASTVGAASYQHRDGTIVDPIMNWYSDSPHSYSGANLEPYAMLNQPNLYNAHLWGADLRGANLSNADLNHASLYRADLTNADLRAANLWTAYMVFATLTDADLTGSNLTTVSSWYDAQMIIDK
jgi:hypothetical protein